MAILRDSRRDKAYFDKWIKYCRNRIDEGICKTYPRLEGQALHLSELFDYSMQICSMCYGRGDAIGSMYDSSYQALQMRELMIDMLNSIVSEDPGLVKMYSRLDLYNYRDTLTLLCLILAVGGKQDLIERAIKACDYGSQDILIGKVFTLLGHPPKTPADKLVFPKMYTPLLAVMEAVPHDRPALMKKFVEGWYKSMKPAAWHNTDGPDSGEGAYYGYWCFEAALITRLLNIDDSSFRDNIYYPADIVHV